MRSRPLTGLAGLMIVAGLTLAGCSGSDSDSGSAADPAPTAASSDPASESASPSGTGTCSYPEDSASAAKEVDPPPATPTRTGQVDVEISTSVGEIDATLDADTTPCTVNSFLSLAQQGYFDDTPCHRLTTAEAGISVLQCGDPSGTGSGGPGYSFDDELSGSETYPAGTLAMANAGPNTNGSQFFVVYGETPLPPQYTVFGKLDADSTKVVADLAALGTATGQADGPPAKKVTITSVKVDD
ncbi:peptidylprolyl isomerase [Nocardioides sp. URHA0020]|uniref:peptidylprolyl isomerase n=1 Tax=Nocardioides sp. URHA0020 TaxID=1380392 RepID=UPI00048B162F|nr:peptidylprolyl isomerase [Nocardioides sp. URHA0020]